MSVTIPVGYGEASIIHTGANGTAPFVCTLGLDLDHYPGSEDQAANGLMQVWGSELHTKLHNTMTIERVIIAVGQAGGEQPTVSSNLPPIAGTRDTANAPINCAIIMNKNTSTLGRKGRGRMFLPGMLAEGQVGLSGGLNTATRQTYDEIFGNILDALTTGSEDYSPMVPVLLHSDPDDDPSVINSFTTAPLCGTLRKRIR